MISKQRGGPDLDNHNDENNVRHGAMLCNPNFMEEETDSFFVLSVCPCIWIKELQIRLDHVSKPKLDSKMLISENIGTTALSLQGGFH